MEMTVSLNKNPYRPGAGHLPPYLAGREKEQKEFKRLLAQDVITDNLVLTGLRGVGKTALLDSFRLGALEESWMWIGAEFTESISVEEEKLALRLLTDISQITSSFVLQKRDKIELGFASAIKTEGVRANFDHIKYIYDHTPGLIIDKLKRVLEISWHIISTFNHDIKGVIFSYDEAQNLENNKKQSQFPLSLLLDVFQSIQKKGIPFMLVLTGLPTLFPKIVEARTYAERMFHVMFLERLINSEARDAIVKPLELMKNSNSFSENELEQIIQYSSGYPYFIQYISKEAYDHLILQMYGPASLDTLFENVLRKLDIDFFQGRWSNLTDRQKDFLKIVSSLSNCDDEFTAKEVCDASKSSTQKSFTPSHAIQILNSLTKNGLIFKNRFGKYSFAIPLFAQFIQRNT